MASMVIIDYFFRENNVNKKLLENFFIIFNFSVLFGAFWPSRLVFFSKKQRQTHLSSRLQLWTLALVILIIAVLINTVLLDELVQLLDDGINNMQVKKTRIYSNILEFTRIYLNLLKFTIFEKRVTDRHTDGRTDGWTDGRTKPLIELRVRN